MKPESSSSSSSSAIPTAIPITTTPPNHISSSSSSTITEFDISTNQSTDKLEIEQKIPIQYHRRHFINYTAYDQYLKETVLGICAAIIVFLFILTIFCASRRDLTDYQLPKKFYSTQVSSLSHERDRVLLNEVYVDVKYDNKS